MDQQVFEEEMPPGSRPGTPTKLKTSKQSTKDSMPSQGNESSSKRSSSNSKVNIVELLFERNLGHCVLRVFLVVVVVVVVFVVVVELELQGEHCGASLREEPWALRSPSLPCS